MESNNISQPSKNETGYIIVKVSTARGVIPLENASVSIRGDTPETSSIIYSTSTNSDGLTEKIALPTPAKSLSESPENLKPYATYNIDVFKDGYIPLYLRNVPVFASVLSVQPAVMVPINSAENNILMPKDVQLYSERENPNL